MQITSFDISEYKGISNLKLDLAAHPQSKVFTLVGLNESGKTTILEAVYALSPHLDNLDVLEIPGHVVKNAFKLIPINKRANFNGKVSLTTWYKLDEYDEALLTSMLRDERRFIATQIPKEFSITFSFTFKDSELQSSDTGNAWNIPITGRMEGAEEIGEMPIGVRTLAITLLRSLLPSVLYFPNFLFEFPDRIYLEDALDGSYEEADPFADEEPTKDAYYRTVLQDVLNSLENNLRFDRHILERAKSGDPNKRQALDSVLIQMGNNMTTAVFQNWNRIFKRPMPEKEIVVSCDKDEDTLDTFGQMQKGRWFIQLRVREANELYSISERSLGFRWFFAFLVLTHYRGFRSRSAKNTIFMLDEPASNLHPSAQVQLLDSFGKLAEQCTLIYTTHSHHLINPEWLEGTFIVKNAGLEYDDIDQNYSARNTDISLTKYRTFVSQHPDQTTYFKPILDALNYSPGKLENVPNVVMLEGKYDFYTLKYIQEKILNASDELNLMPGGGAGSLDNPIRLYIAWGRNFIILLDADAEGNQQKKRYTDLFGVFIDTRLLTLEDVDLIWSNLSLEYLFTAQDRLLIQQTIYSDDTGYNKDHFNRAIQTLYLQNTKLPLEQATVDNLRKLWDFLKTRIEQMGKS